MIFLFRNTTVPVVSEPLRRPSTTTIFRSSSTASDLESDRVIERIPEQVPNSNASNQQTASRNEDRPVDDTNNGEPSASNNLRNPSINSSSSNPESSLSWFHRVMNSAERLETMWSEMNERMFRNNAQETERRINLCYRNLIDQYQSVVRRYCDISRNRDTVRFLKWLFILFFWISKM